MTLTAWQAALATATAISVLLVIYPYILYALVLSRLRTVDLDRSIAPPTRVTLQFCAFNEGAVLQEKLLNVEVLKRRHPDLQVLAYDDGSTDATRDLLAARPDLVTLVEGIGRTGKAHGMKQLAALATGDILVFTDANVLLQEDALDRLKGWYEDPDVGGVCGTLRYLNPGESATASVGGAYWRLEEKLKALESRTGNVMGADGSIFSIRRELYPTFPDTVLDDLTVSMAAVFAGTRLLKVDNVVAFERLVTERKDEFSRKVRIAARAFHTHRYLRPQLKAMSGLDKFKYRSRKMVRWFGGLFLIVGTLSAAALAATISPWAALALVAVLGAGCLAGAHIHTGPVGAVTEIVLALLATLIGVLKAARGQTFTTWSPAKSR